MFAKVLVLAVAVATVSSENIRYRLKTVIQHEAPKEYRHHPHEHIALREYQGAPVSEEHYKLPESHGNAYSSQSIIHQGQAYEASHESNAENVAPVYQYVDENNEEQNAHHAAPLKHKYHAVHYPAPESHEGSIYQHEVPQRFHEVAQRVHEVPQHVHEIPQRVHEVSQHIHEVPQHVHEVPQHVHEVPQRVHEVSQHVQHAPKHEVPVHHVAQSHESHDEPIDYYAYPKYQYEYKVEDPTTGDNKFQHEIRDGDVVKGVYGLHEADGSIRTVEYSSDKHSGFSAIVKHSAPGQHVHIESHHKN